MLRRQGRGGHSSLQNTVAATFSMLGSLPKVPEEDLHSPGAGQTALVCQMLYFHLEDFHFLWLLNILASGKVLTLLSPQP